MPDAREMKVARLLTDELSAEERARLEADVRANAEDAELETQMRGTLGALQSWAEAEDRRPRAVPMASRTKKPAFRRSMAAAAVVAILLLGGATFQLLRQPQVTQATNPPRGGQAVKGSEFAELAWVASLSSTETPRPGGEITFRDPGESGFGGGGGLDTGHEKGGTQGSGSIGGPGNPIEGGGSQGGGKPPITMEPEPKAAPNPALEGFARQFAFAFRIPETLPGRFEFVEGRPVNPKAVELIYRKGTARLSVFLSPAEGPDVPVRGATLGGQELRCIRRHGLCAGFRGSINNADITESMSALVRKENEE